MQSNRLLAVAVAGCTAVILGAFGAHGLKNLVDAATLDIWQKAVSYQFYHTLVLLFLVLVPMTHQWIKYAYICFLIGIVLFSGSLYLLALRDVWHLKIGFLGPITPIGGLFLIAGWLCLGVAALKIKR